MLMMQVMESMGVMSAEGDGLFVLSAPAWRPFLDPINAFHTWWWILLVPMAFGVSVVYRAVRLPTLERYWPLVLSMTAQIVLAMIALGAALYVFVQIFVPMIAGFGR